MSVIAVSTLAAAAVPRYRVVPISLGGGQTFALGLDKKGDAVDSGNPSAGEIRGCPYASGQIVGSPASVLLRLQPFRSVDGAMTGSAALVGVPHAVAAHVGAVLADVVAGPSSQRVAAADARLQ